MTYPPPPPPYGYGAPYGGYPTQQPNTNLVWGILTTLLCCWPLGVVSIVYASKVNGLWFQGRYEEARAASNNARNWAIWSAVSFVVLMIGAIAVMIATDPSSIS
jgi:Interferon-induced transmembrane protein